MYCHGHRYYGQIVSGSVCEQSFRDVQRPCLKTEGDGAYVVSVYPYVALGTGMQHAN